MCTDTHTCTHIYIHKAKDTHKLALPGINRIGRELNACASMCLDAIHISAMCACVCVCARLRIPPCLCVLTGSCLHSIRSDVHNELVFVEVGWRVDLGRLYRGVHSCFLTVFDLFEK